jgi:hypothetical protein
MELQINDEISKDLIRGNKNTGYCRTKALPDDYAKSTKRSNQNSWRESISYKIRDFPNNHCKRI